MAYKKSDSSSVMMRLIKFWASVIDPRNNFFIYLKFQGGFGFDDDGSSNNSF